MKQDELEKLGVVGVNYGSQEPIILQLRLNYAFFAPKSVKLMIPSRFHSVTESRLSLISTSGEWWASGQLYNLSIAGTNKKTSQIDR